MYKTTMFVSRWVLAAIVLLLIVPLVLSACGGTADQPTAAPEPTTVAASTEAPTEPQPPTDPPPTDEPTEPPPTETPLPTETPAPTDTPAPIPTAVVDDSACITCHTDQETLKLVAVEEEVEEELSEGEG